MENKDRSMVNVTGLWLNTDKHDNKYMAGNCGAVRYWVFKNLNKRNEGDPDYLLKISQNIKKMKPKADGEEEEEDELSHGMQPDGLPF